MNAARQHVSDFVGLGEIEIDLDQTRCVHCGAPEGKHYCKPLGREAGHGPEEQPSCTSCGDAAGGCSACDGRRYRTEALGAAVARNPRLARSSRGRRRR